MFADLIVTVLFVTITAAALVCNADKIEDWQDSTQDKDLSWRD